MDVEHVPQLPTFPARWVLDDPRKRQYVVFWVSEDGDRCHAIQMAPTGQPDSVMVTFDDGATQRLTTLRRPLPRGTVRRSSTAAIGARSRAGTCTS